MMLIFFALLAFLWVCPGGLGAGPESVPAPRQPGEVVHFPYFQVPETVYLCGEPVPLMRLMTTRGSMPKYHAASSATMPPMPNFAMPPPPPPVR